MAPERVISKIKKGLDKDVQSFIKNVSDELLKSSKLSYFDVHGLNVSIYIHRGENDTNNKPFYDVYSFDYSENLNYYNELWAKYLEEVGKFSKFHRDIDHQRGWYDNVKDFKEETRSLRDPKKLKDIYNNPLPPSKFLASSPPEYSKKVYPNEFIQVEEGWETFIERLNDRKYNLSWTACFKHIPPEKFEYKDWYISCYLLLNVGELINKPKAYKSAIRPNLNKLLFNVSLLLHEELVNLAQEDLLKESTKAAISQVMARNMSHNIGSHVLSRLITAESMSIEKLLSDNQQYIPLFEKKGFSNYAEEVAIFNSYLKTRMDYLADIATSTPTMQSTKLFKGEILNGLDKNRILLNRISGIKNFEYDLKVVFKDENDNEIDSPAHDFNVAISNDVMGQHAFYIILENIIRNTAKHGSIKTDNTSAADGQIINSKVQFTIQIKECEIDSTFYEVTIFDDCLMTGPLFNISELHSAEERKKYKELFENTRLFEDVCFNDVPRLNKLVFDQNYRLNESVLNEKTMALRRGAWGLIEMDVSAAYLRKIPIEEVDLDKYQIPLNKKQAFDFGSNPEKEKLRILEAVIVPTESARHLGYKFYLPKPKEVLIIDDSGDTWNEIFRKDDGSIDEFFLKELKKQGILFLTTNESFGEWMYDPKRSDYSHEAMLLINFKNLCDYKKSSLPFKILIKDEFYDYYNHYYGSPLSSLKTCLNDSKKFIIEIHRALLYKKMKEENINNFSTDSFLAGRINIDDTNPQYCYKPLSIPNGKTFEIKFSHHGGGLVKKVLEGKVTCNHFEAYGSEVKSLIDKTSPMEGRGGINPCFDEKTTISLLWSGLTNVVVLDERIQEQVDKGHYKPEGEEEVELRKLFEKMNIVVPSSTNAGLNLSAHSYPFRENYISHISNFIDDAIKNNSGRSIKNIDFIVIHLGVIEKIMKAQNMPKEETDIQKFYDELESIYPDSRIIITSGRGKPDNLPSDICFLGYSILSQYTLESRLKYFLVNALNSSRSIQKNKNE